MRKSSATTGQKTVSESKGHRQKTQWHENRRRQLKTTTIPQPHTLQNQIRQPNTLQNHGFANFLETHPTASGTKGGTHLIFLPLGLGKSTGLALWLLGDKLACSQQLKGESSTYEQAVGSQRLPFVFTQTCTHGVLHQILKHRGVSLGGIQQIDTWNRPSRTPFGFTIIFLLVS